jgi:DNA-binding MarR family transcriptional regulator
MNATPRTTAGIALTALILDLFRLNNRILTAGDRLVAGLGLTSARWQVLGTIVATERPQPVAWLARDMGANRQNIQRIVNDLETDGLVAFEPNPHHRRAQLVVLTEKGKHTYDAAMRLQAPWVDKLSDGLPVTDIETTHKVMTALRQKFEEDASLSDGDIDLEAIIKEGRVKNTGIDL